MRQLLILVIAAALDSGLATAFANPVAVITNPAGSFAPVYPTIETPAGGNAAEQQMRQHGIRMPLEKCQSDSSADCGRDAPLR